MRPLDIAFVTVADLPEGGGNTSRLRTLVMALQRAGHRVRIWNQHALGVAPTSSLTTTGTLAGVPFEYVLGTTERSHGFGTLRSKMRAVREISRRAVAARRAGELDVLWFNCPSYYDLAPLSRTARRLGVATVQSYEDERLEVISNERLPLAQRLFGLNSRLGDRLGPRRAGAVVVISHYLREKYEPLCREPERVFLVPTIIDCAEWQLGLEEETDAPHLLYSGSFGEQDDLEGLIDALSLLRDRGLVFSATLLGGTERTAERLARLRRRVVGLKLSDRVTLPGFVPRERVRSAIARSHVLVNIRTASVWSCSGLATKLSEYLAAGRTVVASSVGDVDRYLEDDANALLVRAGATPLEIADTLERALQGPLLRERIGDAARRTARTHFDVPVAQALLDDVLGMATGEGPATTTGTGR